VYSAPDIHTYDSKITANICQNAMYRAFFILPNCDLSELKSTGKTVLMETARKNPSNQ